jgi:hypothetical protein
MQRAYRDAVEAAPSGVQGGMYVADVDADEVVVFLIGMRFNRLRRLRSWLPVFVAMPRMLRQIERVPVPGLLGARSYVSGRTVMVVQYWRSVEELGAYAHDPGFLHHPAWAAFNRGPAATGDVGIYHETYVVPASSVETLYGNVPEMGLAAAFASVPRGTRAEQTTAALRMGQVEPLA